MPRLAALVSILVLLALAAGCDSPTEAEQPKFKNGADAERAIEMPPFIPPPPQSPRIITEWWVIQSGGLWFRNGEEDSMTLSLFVTEVRTGTRESVGKYTLSGFETRPMGLDETFITNEYAPPKHSWSMQMIQRSKVTTILVGVSD
jgi:hypothetical protein